MIRFVRNKKTGMFWDGREWVADISKAQDIPNGFAALDTACQHGLADAEYVVQPGDSLVHNMMCVWTYRCARGLSKVGRVTRRLTGRDKVDALFRLQPRKRFSHSALG